MGYTMTTPRPTGKILVAVIILLLLYLLLELPTGPRTSISRASHLPDQIKPRIAILLMATAQKTFLHTSLKNKQEYARLHDYDLFIDFHSSDPMGIMWNKFRMVERTIEANTHDWIWYIDLDSLITNHTVLLEDLISAALQNTTAPQEETDLILTPDCFPLNAGVMFFRSHPRTHASLQEIRKYGLDNPALSEQDCIAACVVERKYEIPSKWTFIRQDSMNAFPEEIGCYDPQGGKWERGMFVVHFAGAWAHVKSEDPYRKLFEKYEREVVRG